MVQLNAVYKLALFYVEKLRVGEKLPQKFWQNSYGYKAENIIPSLLKKEIIVEGFDLDVSLNNMKVPEIKELLRSNDLKLSGNKTQLIERVKENQGLIDFSSLPRYYVLTDEGKVIKDNSSYIIYFHKNLHDIDIFKADNFYKNNSNLNSNEIIEEIIIKETEKSLKKKEYTHAAYYSNRLAYYYGELNNEDKQIPQIIMGMALEVLQEYKYAEILSGYGDNDEKSSGIIGYNIDLHTKLRAYFDKNNISDSDIERIIFDVAFVIKDDYSQANTITKIIVAALDGDDNKVNALFKNSPYNIPAIPNTDNSKVNYKLDRKKDVNPSASGSSCLIFVAVPLIGIIYSISNIIF